MLNLQVLARDSPLCLCSHHHYQYVVLAGRALQFLTWLLEGPLGRALVVPWLLHRAGITRIRQIHFDGKQ